MIVGYGLTTKGEADRFMKQTLDEFQRLCDYVIICCNNAGEKEKKLIDSYGFKRVDDNREWGKLQWKIKQDFIRDHVAPLKPDWLVCLDMDETFDKNFTKEDIPPLEGKAFYFYIVNLRDDGYAPDMCFWNVRLWKWNGDIEWEQKPQRCGIAPKWAYMFGNYAPFIVKHYGLQSPEDRQKKLERKEKYDPDARYIPQQYYSNVNKSHVIPFDEDAVHQEVQSEVAHYKQKDKTYYMPQAREFYYVKRLKDGVILDIPANHLEQTLKDGKFELVSQSPVVVGGGAVESTTPKEEEPKEPETTEGPKCEECGFIAKSQFGLKSHSKKHGRHNNPEVQ